jgi:hypothetical protein
MPADNSRMHGLRPHQYVALAAALVLHAWMVGHVLFSQNAPASIGKPEPVPVITVSLRPAGDEPAPVAPDPEPGSAVTAADETVPKDRQNPASDATAAPASVPNGPHYYKPRELTDTPVVLQDVLQDQPIHPGDGSTRKLILHLYIDDNGNVDNVVPEGSELSFDDTKILVDKFLRMKFTPGLRNGVAVPVELKIQVEAVATH